MSESNSDETRRAHAEAVRSALGAAFGSASIGLIVPIDGGASGAFPYRADVDGAPCVVRVEGPASPLRNPHQYKSMRIASDAGIAPRVHYIDEETGVVVMDWVAERPLATFPGGPLALARAVGAMVAQVQATTTFPEFVEYPEMVGRLWWWVCQTGLFAPGVLDPYTERLEDIRRSYAWDPAGSVSSHNDPVPRNILFDGTRLWLIDWESAYRNDPLVDVAIVLDNLAPSDQAKSTLIGAWLGRRLDPSTRTRLDQVSALARLYYAGVFLSASAAAFGPLSDRDVSAPTLREFHLAIANRDIAFGSPEAKHILGKMYLSSFMRGTAPPGLSVAI